MEIEPVVQAERLTVEQQIAGHLTVAPPRPSLIRDAVPAGFDEVIARGMAKSPDARYRTAGELAAAARHALTTDPGMRAVITHPNTTVAGTDTHTADTVITEPSTAGTVIVDNPQQSTPPPQRQPWMPGDNTLSVIEPVR